VRRRVSVGVFVIALLISQQNFVGAAVPKCLQSLPGSAAAFVSALIVAAALGSSAITTEVWRKKKTGKHIEDKISKTAYHLQSVRRQLADRTMGNVERNDLLKQESELMRELEVLFESRPLILQWFAGKKPRTVPQVAAGLWPAFAACAILTMGAGLLAKQNWNCEVGHSGVVEVENPLGGGVS